MPRFFLDFPGGDTAVISGQDAVHIRRALRMQEGENLTICDGRGTDYFSEITGFDGDNVLLKVLYHTPTSCEPTAAVTLYQGLPKSDKMEFIIQKAVELGVTAIVPVETARSVARIDHDGEKARKKAERWQKIADEAAGQCGRGILPKIGTPMTFKQALAHMRESSAPVIAFYEGGGQPLHTLVNRDSRKLAVVIGPEGGFERPEMEMLKAQGADTATLGPRILRCETAPLAALAVIMALTGNMD